MFSDNELIELRALRRTLRQLTARIDELIANVDGGVRALGEVALNSDPWADPIAGYVADRDSVTNHEILCDVLGIELVRTSPGDVVRIGKILRWLGFVKLRQRFNGELRYLYRRGRGEAASRCAHDERIAV